jgi:thiosulfate sulfurtransferase
MSFDCISVEETKRLLENDDVTVIDIRDFNSFSKGHINNAIHIDDININNFLSEKDKNETIIIYCYHGISSKSAANFFSQNGFKNVFSMNDGYAGWI